LLINNAGFGDYGDFAERDGERQLNMIQLNIMALVDLTHKFLPLMRQRRSGSIINVSSIAGFQPMPYLSIYAATKAFVLSFSEAIWAENKDYGVKVLVVCPGPTETDFFTEAKFPETLANTNNQIATPEEVVQDALQGLEKGDSTVVSGGLGNKIIVNMHRFLPRESLVSAIAKQFKNNS
jgi:short-subunit dehydrogenase